MFLPPLLILDNECNTKNPTPAAQKKIFWIKSINWTLKSEPAASNIDFTTAIKLFFSLFFYKNRLENS
jgi:hypothetical protein